MALIEERVADALEGIEASLDDQQELLEQLKATVAETIAADRGHL